MIKLGKFLQRSLCKFFFDKSFLGKKIRVFSARLISKGVSKKAIISYGTKFYGNGKDILIEDGAATGINSKIASNCYIGKNVKMGPDCVIITQNHHYVAELKQFSGYDIKPVYIGDNCWIGERVIILPGAKIGKNCIIGAGSVVTKSIPSDSLAYGNPCKVVRKITEEDKLSEELYKY